MEEGRGRGSDGGGRPGEWVRQGGCESVSGRNDVCTLVSCNDIFIDALTSFDRTLFTSRSARKGKKETVK